MKPSLLLFICVSLYVGSCTKPADDPNATNSGTTTNPNTTSTTGKAGHIVFFMTASTGWSRVDVFVDDKFFGVVNFVNIEPGGWGVGYFSSTIPLCNQTITYSGTPGSHAYSAKTDTGQRMQGTFTISSDRCRYLALDNSAKSGDNDDSNFASQSGQHVFYKALVRNVSEVELYVDGVYVGSTSKVWGELARPSCGQNGVITVTKQPGTYSWSTKSKEDSRYSDKGTFTIVGGRCRYLSI